MGERRVLREEVGDQSQFVNIRALFSQEVRICVEILLGPVPS